MYYDRGAHYEFLSLLQELAAPGEMRNNQAFDFEFKNVEKQYESYHGINVKLRYTLCQRCCLCNAYCQLLYSGDSIETNGRCHSRKGSMGLLVQASNRVQQLDQNGRRYRGLSTYRIRILKVKVIVFFSCGC